MKATFLILIAAAVATVASAASINTGVNGGLLGANVADPVFSINGGGATSVMTAPSPLYSYLYYNTQGPNGIGTATADWITSNLGTSAPGSTNYVFTETYVADQTSLSGVWATDNCGSFAVTGGSGAVVTGNTIGASNCGATANFSTPTAFTVSGLTIGQSYTFTYTLTNTDNPSPVSLFVDAGAGATPEPSTVLSVLTGLGLVAAGLRRRKVTK